VNKYFLPYDVYERHKKVGSLIKNDQSVLDVGGELNHLSQFCKPKRIVVANLKSGDVIISKNKIPFRKNSFDIVTSIDVLEHIKKSARKKFVQDSINIAVQKVILSFPLGTKNHIQYEREMQRWLEKTGKDVEYLSEHIKYGLPSLEEIQSLCDNREVKIIFSGNISINKLLFKIFMFDPKIKIIGKVIFALKNFFNLITNPLFYQLLINKNYSSSINRAYLIIDKR